MGYNNNHAGINPVPNNYRWKTDVLDPIDKYAVILAENRLNKKQDNISDKIIDTIIEKNEDLVPEISVELSESEVLEWCKDIEGINIWDTYREEEYCSCGCKKRLQYKKELDVTIRQGEASLSVKVPGRICLKCKKRYIVKTDLIKAIRWVFK